MMYKILAAAALASTLTAADTWTGFLVDARCYDSEERNARVWDLETNHDRDYEVRVCTPSSKTKAYKLVDRNGQSVRLDPAAGAKVMPLLQANHSKPLPVTIQGSESGKMLQVDSISVR